MFQYLGDLMSPRYYIYLIVLTISLTIGMGRYDSLPRKYRLLFFLILITLISEIVSRYLAISIMNSRPAYHVLIPIQSLFYSMIYTSSSNSKTWPRFTFLVVAALSILNTFLVQPIFEFPTYSLALLSVGIITIVLFDFRRLALLTIKIRLQQHPDFWLNLGSMFFFVPTFFIFGFINIGLNLTPSWGLWLVLIANLIMYTCYGFAMYLASIKETN